MEFQAPHGFERWNRSMQGAYRKGWLAAVAGEPESACPYEDKRKEHDNRLTWSRSYIASWTDGHRSMLKAKLAKGKQP